MNLRRHFLACVIFVLIVSGTSVLALEPEYDPEILPQEDFGKTFSVEIPEQLSNLGAASLSYPILIPPGRRAMAPSLALDYNSSGKNGMLGVGWSLSVSSIQRSTKNGLNYNDDEFEHDGAELVSRVDWGPGYFGAKIEGRFAKYYLSSPHGGWVVTTRDGTSYYYGSDPDSNARMENDYGVFKWYLDKVEDANGNYYKIFYFKDQGQIYPDYITYTGHPAAAATNRVDFGYGGRSDIEISYISGVGVKTAKLLTSITTKANGQTARQYILEYETGVSGRSRLWKIEAAPLLPVRFTYQEGGDGAFTGERTTQTEGENDAGYVFTGHCDKDGYPDLLKFSKQGQTPFVYVYQSNGDGTYRGVVTTELAGGTNKAGFILVADFDGDGPVDIVKVSATGLAGTVYFHRGQGDGTFEAGVPSDLGGANDSGRILVVDVVSRDRRLELIKLKSTSSWYWTYKLETDGTFSQIAEKILDSTNEKGRTLVVDCNGDRYDDLVRVKVNSMIKVNLADGKGGFGAGIESDLGNGANDIGHILPGDFNGDGLTDLLKVQRLSSKVYVHFYQANGKFSGGIETDLELAVDNSGRIIVADVNKDGSHDIIRNYRVYTDVDYHLSRSDGTFSDSVSTPATSGARYPGYFTAANIDGLGGDDLIQRDSNGVVYTYRSHAKVPDLLTGIQNGLGATTTFSYKSSAGYSNTYLPFIIQTLASRTVDDGNQVVATTRYDYSKGYYENTDAEFRGFGHVDQSNPDSSVFQKYYFQDEYRKGREYLVHHVDPGNNPLSKTTLTWAQPAVSPGARFVRLDRKVVEHFFDPSVKIQDDFTYSNDHGQIVTQTSTGPGADPVISSYSYINKGFWTWRRTRTTLSSGSISNEVRESTFDYDSSGNMISERQWNDQGDDPETRWTPDAYGNPAIEIDPRGNKTAIEYETVTHSIPAKITYPETKGKTHIRENLEFDYKVSKVTKALDENRKPYKFSWDVLGRLLLADFPDGGLTAKTYDDETFPSSVETRIKKSGNDFITQVDYFDGLKRKIKSTAYGENGKPIYTGTRYDNMGRIERTEGPYFSKNSGYLWEEKKYDFWSRPTRIQRQVKDHGPVATNISYSGLATTTTDPDGSRKKAVSDYLDHIRQIVEYSDHGPIYTYYGYNAAGDLLTISKNGDYTITNFGYDSLGRMKTMDDPDLGYWIYTYDANGNRITQTDPKSQTIRFDYDELNRITSKTYDPPGPSDHAVSYTYDNLNIANGRGRLYSVTNSVVSETFEEYDPVGRVKTVSKTFVDDNITYSAGFEYDLAGNPTLMIYPDTHEVTYQYYPGTRLLHRVVGPNEERYGTFEEYLADGKIGYLYMGNGTATDYQYDLWSSRLAMIRAQDLTTKPANDITRKRYKYTPAGDLKEIEDELRKVKRFYSYDKLHRLKSERSSDAALVHPSRVIELTFRYDDNRPFHAPKGIEKNSVLHEPEYDLNGNMTISHDFSVQDEVPVRSVSYNADNMPTQIERSANDQSVTVAFDYDAENNRAKKIKPTGSTFYIGEHFEVIDGQPTKYIFAGNLRIAKITSTGIQYYHKDHLQSSTALSDSYGEKFVSTEYLPYGLNRAPPGITQTNYGFTDQELDPSTGLYNYDARLYDPVVGQFISADSIVPNWHDPQSLNRYAYARNNPLKYVDPDGHAFQLFSPDTYLDVGLLAWSVVTYIRDPNLVNLAAVGGDLLGIAVPGLTGVGPGIRAGNNAIREGLEQTSKLPSRKLAGGAGDAATKSEDALWYQKISGTAQKTGTPGHQFRSYREAITEAKKPDVVSVHLDHGYNRGLELPAKTIQSNRRPDVLSVYNNKNVRPVEVQSKTDSPAILRNRNAELAEQIRNQGYNPLPPRVVVPTKKKK